MIPEPHLDDVEIAAFADGALDADARQRAEEHLLACDACREVLATSAQLLHAPRPRRRPIVVVAAGLAAAAAVLLIVRPVDRGSPDTPRTRDAILAGGASVTFAADAPADGDPVRLDTLTFRWTSAGPDATYQLTVSTEAGAILWTERTTATSVRFPDSMRTRLDAGRLYYWHVDAILPNLRSASSGQRRLIPISP